MCVLSVSMYIYVAKLIDGWMMTGLSRKSCHALSYLSAKKAMHASKSSLPARKHARPHTHRGMHTDLYLHTRPQRRKQFCGRGVMLGDVRALRWLSGASRACPRGKRLGLARTEEITERGREQRRNRDESQKGKRRGRGNGRCIK